VEDREKMFASGWLIVSVVALQSMKELKLRDETRDGKELVRLLFMFLAYWKVPRDLGKESRCCD
jgi:hypothetical protein